MFILKKSLFLECVQKVGTKVYIVVCAQAHDFQLLDASTMIYETPSLAELGNRPVYLEYIGNNILE